ncbi:hypothetical protein C8R46DRAFT_253485 [Mycena filopes]|nr:hypothetical protein C8R46DRAFT_253485 [Mycena filopes]
MSTTVKFTASNTKGPSYQRVKEVDPDKSTFVKDDSALVNDPVSAAALLRATIETTSRLLIHEFKTIFDVYHKLVMIVPAETRTVDLPGLSGRIFTALDIQKSAIFSYHIARPPYVGSRMFCSCRVFRPARSASTMPTRPYRSSLNWLGSRLRRSIPGFHPTWTRRVTPTRTAARYVSAVVSSIYLNARDEDGGLGRWSLRHGLMRREGRMVLRTIPRFARAEVRGGGNMGVWGVCEGRPSRPTRRTM